MIKLKFPFRLIVAGCSGAGKSTLLGEIIKNLDKLVDQKVDKVIYCSKFEASIPSAVRHLVIFNEGLPTEDQIRNDENKKILFCVDDLLDSAFSSDLIGNLFTFGRHI